MKRLLFLAALAASLTISAQEPMRWQIADDGITWTPASTPLPHYDHIEMSGQQISVVLRYGIDANGAFQLERSLIWPLMRTIPDNCHAATMRRFPTDYLSQVMVDGRPMAHEQVKQISLNGMMRVESDYGYGSHEDGIQVTRTIFPSATAPALIEQYQITNSGDKPIELMLPMSVTQWLTPEERGVDGAYQITASILTETPTSTLQPGESAMMEVSIKAASAKHQSEPAPADKELAQRQAMISDITNNLVLRTPNDTISRAFHMAKIRACESIAMTEAGPMHSPGGEAYYAAIWANDQAEYANPFFAYCGYPLANESAMTSWRLFAGFMNDEYRPIPSSIVSEGRNIWNGAGDRGDAAMIAYGAGRYALATGDRAIAQEIMPLIEWCLEYCQRRLNDDGVVASDCDELENRFPAGDANLCTSSLYYDALISASYLSKALGQGRDKEYASRAKTLKQNILKHFSADVEGYPTYRYYAGNDVLRSWICIPMVMGITDRCEGTIQALLSPRLMSRDGLLTAAGSETFWDRSTLYALRGMYCAGATKEATDFLKHYSSMRLLGEHVPYPIEAWPEGNQRHLSAESALYCRVLTEGLLGLHPIGLNQIELCPQLPDEWNEVALERVYASSPTPYDIKVERQGKKYAVTLTTSEGKSVTRKASVGEKVKFTL
ncbi:MAG: hypothetical protein LUD17_05610 [Bacteroidales bacterium]|nr:hypothetical protein [Bacteroidales bacterium]